jgi:hypothetical protein
VFVSKVYKLGFTSFRSHPYPQSSLWFKFSLKFINGNPGKLKPEPLREFLHAYCEVLEPEARKLHDGTLATGDEDTAANVPLLAKRMDHQRGSFDEITF